jgi:TolB protein
MNRRNRSHLAAILACALLFPVIAAAQGTPEPPAIDPGAGLIELPPITAGGGRFITPIAVPNTNNLGQSDPEGYTAWISDTIRRSLEISGYFDVFGPDRFFFDPSAEGMSAATMNFANWYNVGAQAVAKTAFTVAGNQVSIDFRLYDVDNRAEIDIGFENGVVPIDQVRSEVYDFVNLIIQYYAGAPGIFGSRIAFVGRDAAGHKQIYVMTMDGTGVRAVTSSPTIHLLPSFGPGGELMYTSYRNGNPDLFIGDDEARVLSGRPGINTGAEVSPDGSEIAVTLSLHGSSEIYIMDTDGTIVRRCTENNAEDVSPTWSPDGSRIAFTSDRSGGPQIYVMNADCSNQQRVTFAGGYNTAPEWSPLGDRIAFTGRDNRGRFDIFTVEPESRFITRLTQDQGDNREASWSPDGRYLVFTSTRGGSGGAIYVMTEDGQIQTEIRPGTNETPVWER